MEDIRINLMCQAAWEQHRQYPGPLAEPQSHELSGKDTWDWFGGAQTIPPAWVWSPARSLARFAPPPDSFEAKMNRLLDWVFGPVGHHG